jgi:glycosyltransferase involved in cell wall biosynthesis
MRICFTTCEWPPNPGGIARSAHRIVSGLASAGHTVCVFKPASPADAAPRHLDDSEEISPHGAQVYAIGPQIEQWTNAVFYLDRQQPFDLFHGFYLPQAFPCLAVAQRGRRPVIASIRGIDGVQFDDPYTQAVLRDATWITSVSGASLKRAAQFAEISGRSSVIPNSIDSTRAPRWQLSEANKGVVGTVSTFRKKKNIPLLAQAYARIDPALRRQLLLVGDFLEGKALNQVAAQDFQALLSHLGVELETRITGYIQNNRIHEHLLSMRVFALSSDHEGLPNAVLEAAAAGTPIVSTEVDGIVDIFEPEKEALLVPSRDPVELSRALGRVLADDELALRLSQGSLALAARLTPGRERDSYLRLYEQLTKAG